MDRENRGKKDDSRILADTAVQGLPSKDVDAVFTNASAPVKGKKDTSKLESLFDKLKSR